ncbi:MAG: DUF4878 domain-containing protein [Actinobacteria bacterium]|nr:DUF4878 domain-containing protein [Actinomycetota bacterium]
MSPETEARGVRPGGIRSLQANGARTRVVLYTGLAVLVLLAASFVTGCGDEGRAPKAALKEFLKAEADGDKRASYELLSSSDKEQMDMAAWSAEAGKLTREAEIGRFHFIIADVTLSDSGATVDVLIGEDDDTSNARDVRFLMVKEGDTWKVSYLKTVARPVGRVKTGGGIKWSNVAFGSGTESTARIIVYIIMFLAVYSFYGICLQRVARVKRLRHPWLAWVPFLNIYIAWRIAGRGAISTILSLIPIVNIVMYVLFCFKFSRACGKGRLYGFLQLIPLVNFVAFWLLVESVEDGATAPAPQPA